MKRKLAMMSLVMIAGVPQFVYAKGAGKDGLAHAYSSWNTPYMPHYGSDGAIHPLLDHLSIPAVRASDDAHDAWRLEFAPPPAVAQSDDRLSAGETRLGLSFKLDF